LDASPLPEKAYQKHQNLGQISDNLVHSLIADISGIKQDIVKRKTMLQIAIFPTCFSTCQCQRQISAVKYLPSTLTVGETARNWLGLYRKRPTRDWQNERFAGSLRSIKTNPDRPFLHTSLHRLSQYDWQIRLALGVNRSTNWHVHNTSNGGSFNSRKARSHSCCVLSQFDRPSPLQSF